LARRQGCRSASGTAAAEKGVERCRNSPSGRAEVSGHWPFDSRGKSPGRRRLCRPLRFSTLLFYTLTRKMGKIGPFSEFSARLESRPNRLTSEVRTGQRRWAKMRKSVLSILQTSALPLGYRAPLIFSGKERPLRVVQNALTSNFVAYSMPGPNGHPSWSIPRRNAMRKERPSGGWRARRWRPPRTARWNSPRAWLQGRTTAARF
jgi:hypothetical protein